MPNPPNAVGPPFSEPAAAAPRSCWARAVRRRGASRPRRCFSTTICRISGEGRSAVGGFRALGGAGRSADLVRSRQLRWVLRAHGFSHRNLSSRNSVASLEKLVSERMLVSLKNLKVKIKEAPANVPPRNAAPIIQKRNLIPMLNRLRCLAGISSSLTNIRIGLRKSKNSCFNRRRTGSGRNLRIASAAPR